MRDSKGRVDKVGVRWNTTADESVRKGRGEGKKVINFVTPDSICSASLPTPHIRQRAFAKLFDATAGESVSARGEIKVGTQADLIAGRRLSCADTGDTVFGRGIHLNSIKPLLRSTLDISILNNSLARAYAD